ncbi:MAG: DUF1549 domain-containing protein [Planctomycetota bacterium]
MNDPAADAYEKLVDRLLASPRYGERWARHWLDVVHYGDKVIQADVHIFGLVRQNVARPSADHSLEQDGFEYRCCKNDQCQGEASPDPTASHQHPNQNQAKHRY